MIEYHLPTVAQAGELIRSRLGGFVPKPFPLKALAAKAEGLSYAEIRRAVDESIKETVMHDEERVTQERLGRALQERQQLSQKLANNNNKMMSRHAGPSTR